MSGGIVYDSLFVNNGVAVTSYSNWGPYVSNCSIVSGQIGILAGIRARLERSNICGNSKLNLEVLITTNIIVSRSWLGTASTFLAQQSVSSPPSSDIILKSLRSHPYPLQVPTSGNFILHSDIPCLNTPCNPLSTCNARGFCTVSGKCNCISGWTGLFCETCSFGFDSALCIPPCSAILSCSQCLFRPDCLTCADTGRCHALEDINTSSDASCSQWTKGCEGTGNQTFHAAAMISENLQEAIVSFSVPTDLAGGSQGVPFDCLLLLD